MRSAATIAALELRRRLRDRSLLVQGVLGPILLAGIMGLAFGGGSGTALEVALGLVDEDGSPISTQVFDGLRAVVAGDDGPPVVLEDVATRARAREAVGDDRLDAALVVPTGFGDAILGGGEGPGIEVLATNEKRVSGDIAVSVAEQLAASLDATRISFAVASALDAEPPDRPLEPTLRITEEPVGGEFNAVAYFAPSMAILFLFFTVGAGAKSLLRERADGTLARVRAAPVTVGSVLAGKALAVLVAGIVSLAVVWAVTATAFGADWGAPAGVALVLVGAVIAVAGIAAVLAGLARTEAQAESTTAATAVVLALVGGNFISPGALPPLIEQLSLFTPNGWALRALTELSAGGASVGEVVPAFLVLLGMGAVAGWAGTTLLRRSLS